MGFFSGLLAGPVETRARDFMELVLSARGVGYETATGKKITIHSSMQYSAVYAAQRNLSEDTASLPLLLYRRLKPRGKERATNHRLFDILHLQANSEMTAAELRGLLVSHTVLWGNGYVEIERDRGGRVMALWPLRPDRVDVQRGWDGLLYYHVMVGDPLEHDPEIFTLPARNVMHVRGGLGYDGIKGYSVIGLARQSIGLGLATEEFGARFFGNDARPGGVLEHPGMLSPKAKEGLVKSWNVRHQGLDKSHRLAVLEEGMTYHEIGIPPEDAQFLETRKFQVTEVARWFRMPPHMLADLERSTNNNIEHQGLEYVMYTLSPWLVRIEQRIGIDLLTAAERSQGYFAEHLVAGLLRGDIKSRYEAYGQGRNGGWLSANDIRDMENMNPYPGGDIYLVPLNMVPADMVASPISPPNPPEGGDRGGQRSAIVERRARSLAGSRQRLAGSYERLFFDVIDRVIRREIADVRRATRKYLGKRTSQEFMAWLENFYQEHREFWQRQIMPVLVSYAERVGVEVEQELDQSPGDIRQFIEDYAAALAGRESDSSFQQLRALLEEAMAEAVDPVELIDARLDGWEATRATGLARDESNRAGNAFAWAFYLAASIELIRWVAIGESCPYCRSLNGRVIGIQQVFLKAESDFQPDGAERPLKRRHDIRHGPLHDGCDCIVVAERA